MRNQTEIQKTILPALRERGIVYEKFQKVFARRANEGERINTRTADGLETTNAAKPGDFVVKNQTEAGEEYILSKEKFKKRYQFLREAEAGYAEYQPIGKIVALEMNAAELEQLRLPSEFHFTAPWGEDMVCKKGDFLVSPPDFSEVYRIARKEFFETYRKIK